MTQKISRQRRREMERQATETRLDCLRRGLTTEECVDRIRRAVPDIFALEAWRLANGWTRTEVSARLDMIYQADGLAPPAIEQTVLCRWEHNERRPSDERIEYFCRLYRTRPDRLGFGQDHSPGDGDHLRRAGIIDAYPYTSQESKDDLIRRLGDARRRINLFGLTRNFFGRDNILTLFEQKAAQVPIRIYVMDPDCGSRKDRYRIEPAEAAMEDPERYVREVLRPLSGISRRQPDLKVFTYNFPCSFAIEEIDDVCRVMLYGHGKRGTEGPIITFIEGTPAHLYLADQIRWLERLSEGDTPEPWASKGIAVSPVAP